MSEAEMAAYYERIDNDADSPGWMADLLLLFAFEDCDSLWWRGNGPDAVSGKLTFHVLCSDTFAWGCADAEQIEVGDLAHLAQAKADLPEGDWPLLWVCRKRGMRPMPRWMSDMKLSAVEAALFDAAGPPRESTWIAP